MDCITDHESSVLCELGGWGFPYLISAAAVSWAAALLIERYRAQKASKRRLKYILVIGVIIIVGMLALVKLRSIMPESRIVQILPEGIYNVLLYQTVNVWFAQGSALQTFFASFSEKFPLIDTGSIIAPLGISYYTLSLVGYMADVYWRKDEAEHNPFKFLLFAAYFPKIVEGPISKHRLSGCQLLEGHRFDYHKFCYGLQRMLWGFIKKLVIADRLGLFTDTVLGSYQEQHGAMLLVAVILGSFEIYCDFSGCMDIALGMSEALGITLEENFNHPFHAQSAEEFWRRWHITLGTWFKDYIYMPIASTPWMFKLSAKIRKRYGKRAGKALLIVIPSLAVWMTSGVWHGTGWNYIVWALYWGTIITITTLVEPEIQRLNVWLHIPLESKWWRLFRRVRTFGLFAFGRLISQLPTLRASFSAMKRIICSFAPWELFDGTLLQQGLDWPNLILAIVMILLLMWVDNRQEEGVIFRDHIAALPIVFRWVVYLGGIFLVLIFGIYGAGYDAGSFVYMAF